MTEAEWLACEDPDRLLLWELPQFSHRKLLLFAVSCCRVLQWRFIDRRSWAAVEMVEAFADDILTREGLRPAAAGAEDAWSAFAGRRHARPPLNANANGHTALAAWSLVGPLVADTYTPGAVRGGVNSAVAYVRQGVKRARPVQASLYRDIFGHPIRRAKADPSWLTSTVLELARGIYVDRAFDRLPILADALMDAGCDNADVLDHCRGNGPHARGCWVVDLILGKT